MIIMPERLQELMDELKDTSPETYYHSIHVKTYVYKMVKNTNREGITDYSAEEIDIEKCISCGKCLQSCPFGAIVYNSQMIDVIKHLKNPKQKVVAMVAPSILGLITFCVIIFSF